MLPQREIGEPLQEQASASYGKYEGDQPYTRPQSETYYAQPPREELPGKVYPPVSDNKNMLRLLWFVVSMVTLLVFAIVCLMFVGGTAGWIGFVAASFTIMVTASTAIGMLK